MPIGDKVMPLKSSKGIWIATAQAGTGLIMLFSFLIVAPWTSVVDRNEAEVSGHPLPEGWDYGVMNHGVYTQWHIGKPSEHPILYGLLWIAFVGSGWVIQVLHRHPGSLTSSTALRTLTIAVSVLVLLYVIVRIVKDVVGGVR